MRPLVSPEIVIDTGLRESIQRAAGLEELRAGRHVLRNTQGQKTGEIVVRKLWIAEVQPPVTPAACLATIVSDKQTTVIFAISEITQDRVDAPSSMLRLDPEWSDPVGQALTTLDLWSGGNEISFGGCSYDLFVDTTQVRASMGFGSNPRHPSRMALQYALLEVARLFVTADANSSVTTFLDRWEAVMRGVAH
jgi:hypothetical protein